ncbi:hypothetical protein GS528_16905 [Rhodococcus hoagii]|nr:hypothetical protein [Prescottella equi]
MKPDEPLGAPGIKALQEERDARKAAETASTAAQARIAELEAQIAGAKPDPNLEQRLADLQSRLDAADAARAAAEAAAEKAAVAQLRTDRAVEKGLPAALARKLDGTTAEEIDAEIDELLPLLQLGPRPNPQQGKPVPGSRRIHVGRSRTIRGQEQLTIAGSSLHTSHSEGSDTMTQLARALSPSVQATSLGSVRVTAPKPRGRPR